MSQNRFELRDIAEHEPLQGLSISCNVLITSARVFMTWKDEPATEALHFSSGSRNGGVLANLRGITAIIWGTWDFVV